MNLFYLKLAFKKKKNLAVNSDDSFKFGLEKFNCVRSFSYWPVTLSRVLCVRTLGLDFCRESSGPGLSLGFCVNPCPALD